MSDKSAWARIADGFPPDDAWYWISDGRYVWLAQRDRDCWTNGDTWYSLDRENIVTHWIALEKPELPDNN